MTAHTAIVTGGSRGIGRAIVERLYADGSRVVTCGRGERPAYLPDEIGWVTADVADPAAADRLAAQAEERFGPVSLLVNNAGVLVAKTVADSTDDDWDLQVGVNCRGVFNLSRAVLPQMTEHGGVIVNIGSISGVVADLSSALYNASKAFMHALTRSIAIDHGPRVRCNAVLPAGSRPTWPMRASTSPRIRPPRAPTPYAGTRSAASAPLRTSPTSWHGWPPTRRPGPPGSASRWTVG